MKFLKLIRYQNLLLLAFMQLIFRYVFFQSQDIPLALADWQYGLFVLSTVLIAAGGYVINNIFDQHTDTINKPNTVVIGKSISETQGYNIYIALTATGVSIGFLFVKCYSETGFCYYFHFDCRNALFICHKFKTNDAHWQYNGGFVAFI